jgi:RNA polymerase sigma-70 factor (sigma-E family)
MVTARPALDAPAPVGDPATGDYGLDFDGYVRGNSARLCRSAFLLTGDHQLAEDLVQTALAKVAPRWARIVQGGDPTPYVRTVMVRTAIAWRRRRWRGEVPTAPLPDDERLDPSSATDSRERLRVALSGLPPRQRAAVVLRFYEDLSEAETAAVLGCAVGTVKSQTAKGLAHLRSVLADVSVDPGGQP